jgi:hypothetical protein
MLGQRLMALGTALVCLDGTQLECIRVAGLTAALSVSSLLGCNTSVWSCGHVEKSFLYVGA